MLPPGLLVPAEVQPHGRERRGLGILDLEAEAVLELRLHRFQAQAADRVFPTRLPAIAAITVLLLKDRDGLGGLHHLIAANAPQI